MGDENDPNALLLLGEIRGQLRELIHTSNNNATKIDAMALRIAPLEALPAKVSAIEADLGALKSDKSRRDGAAGLVQTIMRSPALGWLVGAATAAWAILTGKVDLP